MQIPRDNVGGEGEWVTLLTFNYCQGGLQQGTKLQLLWWTDQKQSMNIWMENKAELKDVIHLVPV